MSKYHICAAIHERQAATLIRKDSQGNNARKLGHHPSSLRLNRSRDALLLIMRLDPLARAELLLDNMLDLMKLILLLEQEGQLLESAPTGLREQEVDEDDLESEPEDVGKIVLPAGVLESDGVDIGVEEVGKTAKELEDGDTTGTGGVWEEFDEVCVGESIVGHVVTGGIGEDEEDNG